MALGAPLLEVGDLSVSIRTYRGEVKPVRGVSFSVDRGEIFAIVGESGCGKSTVAQTLMKLNPSPPVDIKGGYIIFKGKDISHLPERDMRPYRGHAISMIFQDPMTSLNPTMKVGKQIAEAMKVHGTAKRSEIKPKVIELLKSVGIPSPEERAQQYPFELSGGLRQRVMIAMALACDPDLLIADEPTTALDVTIQAQVLDLMKKIPQERNNAVILITHDLGVVAQMATNVAVMYAGEIMEQASCAELFKHPVHPYTRQLLAAKPSLHQNSDERLVPIEGTPPDLRDDIAGCPFAPRCAWSQPQCFEKHPEPVSVGEFHKVRCLHAAEMSERAVSQNATGISEGESPSIPAAATDSVKAGDGND